MVRFLSVQQSSSSSSSLACKVYTVASLTCARAHEHALAQDPFPSFPSLLLLDSFVLVLPGFGPVDTELAMTFAAEELRESAFLRALE